MSKRYDIIFTDTIEIGEELNERGLRCDVLILDENGHYYNPQYITLERITNTFGKDKNYLLEENIVIMHVLNNSNILETIKELDKWLFQKRWHPLSQERIEKYFYPKDNWETVTVIVE